MWVSLNFHALHSHQKWSQQVSLPQELRGHRKIQGWHTFVEELLYIRLHLLVISHPTPQQTEQAWSFPAHTWARACTEAVYLVHHLCIHFPVFWKCYSSLSMEPIQNMCCCPLLLCSFSVRPLLQLAGLPSVHLIPNWQSRAEYFIFGSLSLTPCLNPHPTPALSLPSGGLNFNWLNDHEVGMASSCFGRLFIFSIKLTRVLVNHVATPWLCSLIMCGLW